ncbi:HEAT repeat-containing protein, partial [Toxoplasma gondii ARI]
MAAAADLPSSSSPFEQKPLAFHGPTARPPTTTYNAALASVLSLALPSRPDLARLLSSPRHGEASRRSREGRCCELTEGHREGEQEANGDPPEQSGRALSEAIEAIASLPFLPAAARASGQEVDAAALGAEEEDEDEREGGGKVEEREPRRNSTRLKSLQILSDVSLRLIDGDEEEIAFFWSHLSAEVSRVLATDAHAAGDMLPDLPSALAASSSVPSVRDVLRATFLLLINEGEGEEGELAALLYLRMLL